MVKQKHSRDTKIVGFGEVMLRLKSLGHERLFQSPSLEASFGGSEFNVLASLARFGFQTEMVTAVPGNGVGDACLADIRSFGIGTDHVIERDERLGTYYLEAGADHRASNVIYDRAGSAFSQLTASDVDWKTALKGAGHLHFSGINLALSPEMEKLAQDAITVAKEQSTTVSFDINYRSKLWQSDDREPSEVFRKFAEQADILFASELDGTVFLGAEIDENIMDPEARFRSSSEQMLDKFPQLRMVAATIRAPISASRNKLTGCIHSRDGFATSRTWDIAHIVDRVGGGDAYAAGILFGALTDASLENTVEYAAAAACLKHSIPGDVNRATQAEVELLLGQSTGGHVNR